MPISDKDLQPLIHALGFNTYFTTIILRGITFEKSTLSGLVEFLSLNRTVIDLTIADISTKSHANIGVLFDAMKDNRFLKIGSLNLYNSVLDDKKDRLQLAAYLQTANSEIVELDLSLAVGTEQQSESLFSREKADGEAWKKLFHALQSNKQAFSKLAVLNLNENKLEHVDDLLFKYIKRNESLEELHLSGTRINISKLSTDGLSESRISHTLRHLNISNFKLSHKEQWIDLVKWLTSEEPVALEVLDISETGIPPETLAHILTHISPSLTSISVKARKNNLGKEGGTHVGQAAAKILRVHELDLAETNLGDEGIHALAEGLYHNKSIKILDIGYNFKATGSNKVRKDSVQFLNEMIKSPNLPLHTLLMPGSFTKGTRDSRLKDGCISFLTELGKYGGNITSLDLTGHSFGNPGAIALGQCLEINHTLTQVLWDDNAVGVIGLQNVAESLKFNSAIQMMPLPVNDISKLLTTENDKEKKALLKAIEKIEKKLQQNQRY